MEALAHWYAVQPHHSEVAAGHTIKQMEDDGSHSWRAGGSKQRWSEYMVLLTALEEKQEQLVDAQRRLGRRGVQVDMVAAAQKLDEERLALPNPNPKSSKPIACNPPHPADPSLHACNGRPTHLFFRLRRLILSATTLKEQRALTKPKHPAIDPKRASPNMQGLNPAQDMRPAAELLLMQGNTAAAAIALSHAEDLARQASMPPPYQELHAEMLEALRAFLARGGCTSPSAATATLFAGYTLGLLPAWPAAAAAAATPLCGPGGVQQQLQQ
ncbi:hypothetical protein OEZ86_004302 [Tetradesmus obliquus]|nr:hypothetical protein OEZ86_004302 [Tetradesmus obliquus]